MLYICTHMATVGVKGLRCKSSSNFCDFKYVINNWYLHRYWYRTCFSEVARLFFSNLLSLQPTVINWLLTSHTLRSASTPSCISAPHVGWSDWLARCYVFIEHLWSQVQFRQRGQHPGTMTPNPEHQSAQMSKITNGGLTQSGTGCCIAVPIWQQWS